MHNFESLGLKKLITTCYKSRDMDLFSRNECESAVYLEYEGDKNGNHIPNAEEIGVKPLKGDGDFRSKECIKLLEEADIVGIPFIGDKDGRPLVNGKNTYARIFIQKKH